MTSTAETVSRPATQCLREDTKDLHTQAEKGPFQVALMSGRLPREGYAAMLGQMLLVHRALEAGLRRQRAKVSAIAKVVTEEQYQEPYLLEDLAFFGVDAAAVRPTPATTTLIGEIARAEREEPLALLGLHYVLEGSNNGNRFIARPLMKAYGLTPPGGLRYMLPYGEKQPELWAKFKVDLDGCGLSEREIGTLVRAAETMYRGIIGIHNDLASEVGG